MIEVTDTNYEAETKEGLVLVDFWSPQCNPCRMLNPILEKLQSIKVLKANTFDPGALQIAVKAGVSALPTLLFLKDGVEVARMSGLQSQQTLQAKIDELNG